MKFKIKRSLLLTELDKVLKAVPANPAISILKGIKLDLTNSNLVLTGSDHDLTIQSKINSDQFDIIDTGSIVLPARMITDIVRKMEGNVLSIEVIDSFNALIEDGISKFNLLGMNPIDYIDTNLIPTGNKFNIKANLLKEIINQTKFAASSKESNPVLTGINFILKDNILDVYATDSYRLAKKEVEIENDFDFNITIPKASLEHINKVINEDDITLYITNRLVLFTFDNVAIRSRLIDGNYPNLDRFINIKGNKVLTINKHNLKAAISRVSLLESESNNLVQLDVSRNKVNLSTFTQEKGSVDENIVNFTYDNDPLTISFSSIYANNAIDVLSGENIEVILNSSESPIIFKEIDNDKLIQLVLPVRTH